MSKEDDLKPAAGVNRPEVVDPNNAPVLFVDWVITGGMFDDVVNISLGSIDHAMCRSDTDLARVMVAARLRFSRTFALHLHRSLGNILGLNPPAEPPSQPPPRNTLN